MKKDFLKFVKEEFHISFFFFFFFFFSILFFFPLNEIKKQIFVSVRTQHNNASPVIFFLIFYFFFPPPFFFFFFRLFFFGSGVGMHQQQHNKMTNRERERIEVTYLMNGLLHTESTQMGYRSETLCCYFF